MAFALSVVAFSVAALCACVHEPTIGVAAIGVTILGIVKALLGRLEKFSVIDLSRPHIPLWMEERGEETNGLGDPIGSPRII